MDSRPRGVRPLLGGVLLPLHGRRVALLRLQWMAARCRLAGIDMTQLIMQGNWTGSNLLFQSPRFHFDSFLPFGQNQSESKGSWTKPDTFQQDSAGCPSPTGWNSSASEASSISKDNTSARTRLPGTAWRWRMLPLCALSLICPYLLLLRCLNLC